jgi:O-antigen/teichoic acid export membrane protein
VSGEPKARRLVYPALRASTAFGALASGFCQTYVFARVLTPEQFSIYIVIGSLGVSLWLFDLGIAKVLFVQLRDAFLKNRLGQGADEQSLPVQAAGIALLYAALVVAGTLACFLIVAGGTSRGSLEAGQEALLFAYTALNLVWFVLRNVSVAGDQFIYFESLDAVRRAGHIGLTFCLFLPISFISFILWSNLLWAVLFVLLLRRLGSLGLIRWERGRMLAGLSAYFRRHSSSLWSSGRYALGEMYIYTFPSLLVPALHGLGGPTIVFDTVFKVFRGATVVFSAACDLLVPRQTRVFAAGDTAGLRRHTLQALVFAALPALCLCLLLAFAGDRLFGLLLGNAAQVPAAFNQILIVLVLANLVQTVSNFVLVHTGFFAPIGRLATTMALLMTLVAVADAVFRLTLLGFAMLYAAVYVLGAVLYAVLAARHPLAGNRPKA